MKVLIVEDEILTSKRLKKMLLTLDSSIEVIDMIDSIESSVEWFNNNPAPDLVFMDIQLSDGLCFEIFDKVKVDPPVIFTTAFDEYAIQAFKVNSIDYLLKPIKQDELKQSLQKFHTLKERFSSVYEVLKKISFNRKVYKARFLVKTGQAFVKVDCNDIAFFHSENKLTYIILFSGKKYTIDYTLDELERELNPESFFRISRQYIININSVESVHTYFGGSLKLHLNPKVQEEIIISRRRAAGFKDWMDR